jgi:putative Ca2+/H+ antiporter (TMEM165/GDT1 family)
MQAFAYTFVESMFMIIVTELGDKTFFIAAILAMRALRSTVFAGAIGALALMTVLSAALGLIVPALIPPVASHLIAAGLFGFFGYKLLREASSNSAEEDDEPDEMREAQEALNKKRDEGPESLDIEGNPIPRKRKRSPFSPILVQAFTLTFMAEWGDRSQIATIGLAAARNPWAVTVGAIFGHCLCTGLAVLSGKLLSQRISMKTVNALGGVLFVIFAVVTLVQL